MLRMFARRMSQKTVSVGTDRVVAGITLPSDSVVHNVSSRISVLINSIFNFTSITGYAVEAWIVPLLDPDAASPFDTLWDTLVPKDTDVETLDLDTGTVDTTPFYEPGEIDLSQLFDVGLRPERIYQRIRIMTATQGAAWVGQDNVSPFAPRWVPGEAFHLQLKKRYRVRQPSALLIGFASPSFDDTVATNEAALGEAEIAQVKYMGEVVKRAMLHQLGLTEAGAETPWEEATALIKKHLEPDIDEEETSRFAGGTWQVVAKTIIDHSVVGELGKGQISTGR